MFIDSQDLSRIKCVDFSSSGAWSRDTVIFHFLVQLLSFRELRCHI